MRVRCVTFNLKGMGSEWFEKRFDAAARGLRSLSPDIVCFQETTIRSSRGMFYDQARALGEGIGLRVSAFAPYGNPVEITSRDQGGIGFVSRWPICSLRNRRLLPGHDHIHDVRVAMFARLLTPEGPLELATSHLSWRPEEDEVRLMQMGMILEDLLPGREGNNPRQILMGDFNATEDEGAIRLASESYIDAYRAKHATEAGHTWDNRNPLAADLKLPDRRVDYIFCDKGALVHACEVALDQPPYASDHFAVVAELEW